MDSGRVMIYGAYGFTGTLVVEALVALGIRPVLAGRDAVKLGALAQRMGLPARVATLASLPGLLDDITVLLLAAGPFAASSEAAVAACLATRTHYLDLSGEYESIERVRRFDAGARARGLMLLPAVGFDVVASDCLLAHVAGKVAAPSELMLAVAGLRLMSRGSAITLVEQLARHPAVRRGGRIIHVPMGSLRRSFDFGAGPRDCVVSSWGDVATAYYTTGAPDITVYFETNPLLDTFQALARPLSPWLGNELARGWMRASAEMLGPGPRADLRATHRACLVAVARGSGGRSAAARLRTAEAYGLSQVSAAAIVQRVLAGDLEPGFQTPARVYGPDLVLTLGKPASVERSDLDVDVHFARWR